MSKMRKSVYIIFIVIFIISIILAVYMNSKSKHEIGIYLIPDGMTADPATYQTFIDQNEPVITEKDIKAYNPDLQVFFLSDEKINAYREAVREMSDDEFANSTSIILGAGISDGFIVAVDGKPAFGGHIKRPLAMSFVPATPVMKDCAVGLEIASYGFAQAIKADGSLLVEAFRGMRLLTDEVPPISDEWNPRYMYYPNEMWKLREYNSHDCIRMASLLPISDKLEISACSTDLGAQNIAGFNNKRGISISYKGSGSPKDYEYEFDEIARLFFALYDGVDLINFSLSPDDDSSSPKRAIYVSSDLIDYLPESSSGNYYKSVSMVERKIKTKVDLYKYMTGRISENDYNIIKSAVYGEPTGVVKVNNLDTDDPVDEKARDIIDKGLEVVMSSPKSSSIPMEYVKEHQDDFEYMLKYMGDGGLDYILREFELKKATGLRGELLAILANEYVDEKVDEWDSAIEWYQKYIKKVESEIKLPDYEYEADKEEDFAYLKEELYKFDLDEYKDDRAGFTIDIFYVVGTVENEDLTKVFAVRRRNKYRLYGEVLELVSGGNYPMAITIKSKVDGDELIRVEHALDGGLFADSIRDMCKDPLTNERLDKTVVRDISKKMMYNDEVADYFKIKEEETLRKHLIKNGVKKAVLYSPFDEVWFELNEDA